MKVDAKAANAAMKIDVAVSSTMLPLDVPVSPVAFDPVPVFVSKCRKEIKLAFDHKF